MTGDLSDEDRAQGLECGVQLATVKTQLEMVDEVIRFVEDTQEPVPLDSCDAVYLHSPQTVDIIIMGLESGGVQADRMLFYEMGLQRQCKGMAHTSIDNVDWDRVWRNLSTADDEFWEVDFALSCFPKDQRASLQQDTIIFLANNLFEQPNGMGRFRCFVDSMAKWLVDHVGFVKSNVVAKLFEPEGDLVVLSNCEHFSNDIVARVAATLRAPLHILHHACTQASREFIYKYT